MSNRQAVLVVVRRNPHDFDEDAVCVKCQFDGAEWASQWPNGDRAERRPALPECEVFANTIVTG